MPTKRRPVPKVPVIPKSRRVDVTRGEFDRIIYVLNARGQILNDLRHNQDLHLKRMAQMQAELDRLTTTLQMLSDILGKT